MTVLTSLPLGFVMWIADNHAEFTNHPPRVFVAREDESPVTITQNSRQEQDSLECGAWAPLLAGDRGAYPPIT